MALACTRWGWSPEAFWRATPLDFMRIARGLDALQAMEAADEFGAGDVLHLRRLIEEHMKTIHEDSHGV